MKILTQSEVRDLQLKTTPRRTPNPIISSILRMERGSTALVTKQEWAPNKTYPNPNNLGKRQGMRFEVRSLADDTGWVVTRLV